MIGNKPHMLLDRDAQIPRCRLEVKKLIRISDPLVRDHVVSGNAVLPGAHYLELIREVAVINGEGLVHKIKKIFWKL